MEENHEKDIKMSPILFKILSTLMALLISIFGVVLYFGFSFILENKSQIATWSSSTKENTAQWKKLQRLNGAIGKNTGKIHYMEGYQKGLENGETRGEKNIINMIELQKRLILTIQEDK